MMKLLSLAALASLVALTGCRSPSPEPPKTPPVAPKGEPKQAEAPTMNAPTGLAGAIKIEGSTTVLPISEAAAEEIQKANPKLNVTVGASGTGGGFKKFAADELDICDASRPVKDSEIEACAAKKIEFIELPIAFDGVTVNVNPQNTFVDKLTVAELKKMWEPDSKVQTWKDVRASWPAEPVKLYGPGTDSGTFEYFTEAVNGKAKACRSDYNASTSPNVQVTGISGDKGALGFFGYAYYAENKDKLKLVPIADGDKEAVLPSEETIANGTYKPLSRPLFLYVKQASADRPEVQAFVKFYLENAAQLVKKANYIPLPKEAYDLVLKRFAAKKTGTVFKGIEPGLKLQDVLAKEQ